MSSTPNTPMPEALAEAEPEAASPTLAARAGAQARRAAGLVRDNPKAAIAAGAAVAAGVATAAVVRARRGKSGNGAGAAPARKTAPRKAKKD